MLLFFTHQKKSITICISELNEKIFSLGQMKSKLILKFSVMKFLNIETHILQIYIKVFIKTMRINYVNFFFFF